MKKFYLLVIISIFMLIIAISGLNSENTGIIHELYIPKDSKIISNDAITHIDAGSYDIVRVGEDEYVKMRDKLKDIYGESISMTGNVVSVLRTIDDLDIKIVEISRVDSKRCIYGYSDSIKNSVLHNDKLVNIQIVYGNNQIEIGTPLIMGDY